MVEISFGIESRSRSAYPQTLKTTWARTRSMHAWPFQRCQTLSRSKPTRRSSAGMRASSSTWTSARYALSRPVRRATLVSTSPVDLSVRLPPCTQSQTISAALPSRRNATSEPAASRREAQAAAVAAIAERTPDAVVLDVMMPGYDGLDVTRRLRREGNRVPVLLLTARDAVGDRVDGLDAGADDYLPKPFALEELLARLRALLRRSLEAEPADLLRFADLTFDLGSMEARRAGRRFELTTTEAHLLELFMRNPRQVLPRPLIYERVWGYDFSHSSNALDVYVGYLRRKTEGEGESRLIHTVRGTGYVLREP